MKRSGFVVAVELNNNHQTKSLQIVLCAFGFFLWFGFGCGWVFAVFFGWNGFA